VQVRRSGAPTRPRLAGEHGHRADGRALLPSPGRLAVATVDLDPRTRPSNAGRGSPRRGSHGARTAPRRSHPGTAWRPVPACAGRRAFEGECRHRYVLPSGIRDLHAMERRRGVASPEGAGSGGIFRFGAGHQGAAGVGCLRVEATGKWGKQVGQGNGMAGSGPPRGSGRPTREGSFQRRCRGSRRRSTVQVSDG
jgi:hypothetical protein